MASGGGLSHPPPAFLSHFGKDVLGHNNAGILESRSAPPLQLPHLEIPRPMVPDERDAFISWLRGEFAAANAIIDAMCHHLRMIGDPGEYDFVLTCIQQRRFNWTVVLHMQQFFSVAEVVYALQQVTWRRQQARSMDLMQQALHQTAEEAKNIGNASNNFIDLKSDPASMFPKSEVPVLVPEDSAAQINMPPSIAGATIGMERQPRAGSHTSEETPGPTITRKPTDPVSSDLAPHGQISELPGELEPKKEASATASKSPGSVVEKICNIEFNALSKEDEESRLSTIKVSKQFQCWEQVEGSVINVVEGLEIYENVLSKAEASHLAFLISELHTAGRRGDLRGQSFTIEKKSTGKFKESMQFGHAFCGNSQPGDLVEPMPLVFSSLIDRLIQWHIVPAARRPDCCCIDILEEGESSSPHIHHPQLEKYVCSISLLADCTVALGHKLSGENEGSFKFLLQQGAAGVLQGNSANIASQAVLASPGKRIIITFGKITGNKVPSVSLTNDMHVYPAPSAPPARPSGYGAGVGIRGLVPAVVKHYGVPTASGVLPIPPVRPSLHAPQQIPQQLAAGNLQALIAGPVGSARGFPGVGIINPGWASVPRAPRLPNTGTGVFFPSGGSSSSNPGRPAGSQMQPGVVLGSPMGQKSDPLVAYSATGSETSTFVYQSSNRSLRPPTSTELNDQFAERSVPFSSSLNTVGPNDPAIPRRTGRKDPANAISKTEANGNRNMKDEHHHHHQQQQQRSFHRPRAGVGGKS